MIHGVIKLRKKNKLTVYTWPNKKSYYLLRPWKWVKELLYNRHCAKQRIRRGYCDSDWYNFYAWFLYIVPQMLRDIADKGHGYPASGKYDTPEKWHDWLHRMAENLEKCQDDNAEENEYGQELDEAMKLDNPPANINILRMKFRRRDEEISQARHKLLTFTLKELADNFNDLWD